MDHRMRCLLIVFLAVLGVLGLSAEVGLQAALPQQPLLPRPLASLIRHTYPTWKITTLADLEKGDRELWLKSPDRRGAVPGIARGHFESNLTESRALMLFRRQGKKTRSMLLLASPKEGKWRLTTLASVQVDNPAVVWKVPPGEYTNWDKTEKLKTSLDGIVMEGIESWSVLHYKTQGQWKTFQLTD